MEYIFEYFIRKDSFQKKTFFNSSIFPNSPIKHYNITHNLNYYWLVVD